MLGVALALSVLLSLRLRTPTYPIAVAWALVGILAANGGTAFGLAAGIGALILLALGLRQLRA
jgi:hypothetical protein